MRAVVQSPLVPTPHYVFASSRDDVPDILLFEADGDPSVGWGQWHGHDDDPDGAWVTEIIEDIVAGRIVLAVDASGDHVGFQTPVCPDEDGLFESLESHLTNPYTPDAVYVLRWGR